MRISTLFRSAIAIVKAEGFKSLYVRSRNRLVSARAAGNSFGVVGMLKKINIIEYYDFVLKKNAGTLPLTTTSINKKTIKQIDKKTS